MATKKNTPAVSPIAILAAIRQSFFDEAHAEKRSLTEREHVRIDTIDVIISSFPATSDEDAKILQSTAGALIECLLCSLDEDEEAFWIKHMDAAIDGYRAWAHKGQRCAA